MRAMAWVVSFCFCSGFCSWVCFFQRQMARLMLKSLRW